MTDPLDAYVWDADFAPADIGDDAPSGEGLVRVMEELNECRLRNVKKEEVR